MHAVFIESPAFERHRPDYLSDEEYRAFQNILLEQPKAGDVIKGSGGSVKFVIVRKTVVKENEVESELSIIGLMPVIAFT